jgi:asparagine synthase (glutamine-hydrolysing)
MCGIFGFLTRRQADVPNMGLLRMMRETMTHRGPDNKGEYTRPMDERGPFVYFGHRRLSIIDLAGGHQPLSNEDGTVWVLLNGEIYNFQELKAELEENGHRFQTVSDTEVIAHGYEEFGKGCFDRLHGMFAIAIWDERQKKLLLARDRLGKKPLYYSLIGESFLFASELKTLIAYPQFPRQIDPLSFMKYLFYEFIPSPHTIFRDATKLSAASYLTWDKGGTEIKKYWSPFHKSEPASMLSEGEAIRGTLDLLSKGVKRRLISDVPLGIFLSGGIDSSMVAALAQREARCKIKTFSISFEDPSFDESKYALLASKHIGTEHYEKRMNPEDLLRLVPRLPDILDEPMADASIIPTYLLSQFTREQVTVALGGDGGDELFAGYPTYMAHKIASRYDGLLKALLPTLNYLGDFLPVSDDNISFDFKVKKFLSGIAFPDGVRNYVWLGSFSPSDLPRALSPQVGSQFDESRMVQEISYYMREFRSQDRISVLQYLDLRLYLQEAILVKVDRASMANSLEVRAPFLDHELVELVMGLPSVLKLRGFTPKYLLKKAASAYLPSEIIHRKKKGFGVPIAKWIKGPLKELFLEMFSNERLRREGFLSPQYVEKLLQDHLENRRDNRKQLWTLLVWELWQDRYHPTI